MALSTQSAVLAKRRAGHYTVKPGVEGLVRWFFSYVSQFLANPDLQIVEFAALSSSEVIIADVACRLYAVVYVKDTATATYSKITDSATTSSDADSEFRLKHEGVGEQSALIFPDGAPFASGITMQGNTTPSGGTGSAANGARGYVILGAA